MKKTFTAECAKCAEKSNIWKQLSPRARTRSVSLNRKSPYAREALRVPAGQPEILS